VPEGQHTYSQGSGTCVVKMKWQDRVDPSIRGCRPSPSSSISLGHSRNVPLSAITGLCSTVMRKAANHSFGRLLGAKFYLNAWSSLVAISVALGGYTV
jgi:hypothetical protein